MLKQNIEKSDKIWKWYIDGKLNEFFPEFTEIETCQKYLQSIGMKHCVRIEDGGKTIICKHSSGKIVGKIRENCFSDGCSMNLVEVIGLIGAIHDIGFLSAEEAIQYIKKSLAVYENKKLNKSTC